jgi:hypothetical protein
MRCGHGLFKFRDTFILLVPDVWEFNSAKLKLFCLFETYYWSIGKFYDSEIYKLILKRVWTHVKCEHMWNYVFHMWSFTCEFSHVNLEHVNLEHVTFHMWTHVKLCVSHVKFHIWNFTCEFGTCEFGTCDFSHVNTCEIMCFTCETSHVKFHMWGFTCEFGTCEI